MERLLRVMQDSIEELNLILFVDTVKALAYWWEECVSL